jgi:DNA-binding CsgD family transcriptional regulator
MLEDNPRGAIGYLRISYEKAMENDHLQRLANLTELLAEAYEESGRLDSSIVYYRKFIVYSDSLAGITNDRKIASIRYEADLLREKEHFMAQTQLLRERNAHRNRLILLISILIVVGLLSIILYLRFRMKRNVLVRENILLNNKNLSAKLESRKKETAAQLLYLEQKNNLIKNIATDLKAIVPLAVPENKKKILDSIRKLEKAHYANNWSEFEVLFRDIHSDFYTRLNRKFPDLTPNEQKLCAFILMNMSTKDIAGITFQNYEAIRTARHRLRKKLNVESDQHLLSFLSQI